MQTEQNRISRAAEHHLVMEYIYGTYGHPPYPIETEADEIQPPEEAQEEPEDKDA